MPELNEIKDDLRWIEEETEAIKREQEYVERSAPFDIKKMFRVGLFFLFLGLCFAFVAFQGIFYQLNIFLNFITGLLAICLIYVGARLTKIGYKYNNVVRKGERVFKKAERIKNKLEQRIADKQ